MVRNALIAAGNSAAGELAAPVARLLDDPAPVVRGTAIWALSRLAPARLAIERAARHADEGDPTVREEWDAATSP